MELLFMQYFFWSTSNLAGENDDDNNADDNEDDNGNATGDGVVMVMTTKIMRTKCVTHWHGFIDTGLWFFVLVFVFTLC